MNSTVIDELRRIARPIKRAILGACYGPPPQTPVRLSEPPLSEAEIDSLAENEFKYLLERIAAGESVAMAELLPYLSLERKQQRKEVNLKLAQAYVQAGKFEPARPYAERAFLFSDFADDLLGLLQTIFKALGDTAAIKNVYKKLGLIAAARGDYNLALDRFWNWQYAYNVYNEGQLDKYEYDFEIMSCIDSLVAPYRIFDKVYPAPLYGNSKPHIGYVLRGIVEHNSILMKIMYQLAEIHDRTKFDIDFYCLEAKPEVKASKDGAAWLHKFAEHGYAVRMSAETVTDKVQRTRLLADLIHKDAIDLLITSAGLADFEQYMLGSLRPAPLMVALVQGPPPQFAPPNFDWAVSWSMHPLLDTPLDCSFVPFKPHRVNETVEAAYRREDLQLPDDAFVIMSAGRPSKFQDASYWRAVADLLADNRCAHYVAVGPRHDEVPQILPSEILQRVHFLGWRSDVVRLLPLADVVIDTYPNGGGVVIAEAMSLGLPLVVHQNDFAKLYDQTTWSPAEDYIDDPEMIIPRGDFERLKGIATRMAADKEYRLELGKRCKHKAASFNPALGVRQLESVYEKILDLFSPDWRNGIC